MKITDKNITQYLKKRGFVEYPEHRLFKIFNLCYKKEIDGLIITTCMSPRKDYVNLEIENVAISFPFIRLQLPIEHSAFDWNIKMLAMWRKKMREYRICS